MQFFRNPHPEIPMPFSFFTITLHFCTSDMVEGLFPQMWANCGIFVEQSQSFHRFSARWKNCCKRGDLSTKKPSLQTVEQVNGGGRWIALRGAAPLLALSAPHCRTRWFDSTMLRIVLCCAVISQPVKIKKAPQTRCFIFSTGGGRWIRTIEVSDSRFTVCPL